MILVIAPLIVIATILFGGLLAWLFAGADRAVKKNYSEIDNKDKGYNQRMTFGHRIKVEADPEEQVREARLEAARQAANTPRGDNVRIGSKGASTLKTAGDKEALANDPWSAAKIAQYHGWDGVQTGAVVVEAAPGAPAAAGTVAAPTGQVELVPGKDYEYIEITDSMSPDEKRKARIANSKAKSVAMKTAKASQGGAATAAVGPMAASPAAAVAQPVAAAPITNIVPPVLIEITDAMSPDDVRKARIANSKANSAFNKALKAAGIDPQSVEVVDGKVVMPAGAVPAAAPAPAAAEPAAATSVAAPVAPSVSAADINIPPPQLIEITDDMTPDQVRQARIANSKAKSAYNKALKAAGIDPQSVQ
jgi:hypothetical protein